MTTGKPATWKTALLLLAACGVLGLLQPLLAQAKDVVKGPVAYTPQPGSAERQAIMDAVRADAMKYHKMKMVFRVMHLKVSGVWAYTHVMPRSPDGSQHYEDLVALLKKVKGRWRVMELPPGDPENPEETDQQFAARVRKMHPAAPIDIF